MASVTLHTIKLSCRKKAIFELSCAFVSKRVFMKTFTMEISLIYVKMNV